jgi:formamidopyrimidine-DNA glycosylase
MPELPEVRAHAERLSARLGGSELERFQPLSFTALKSVGDPAVAVGQPLLTVVSRGKHLVLRFPSLHFVVHLMQGGRLRSDPKPAAKPRGGLARWWFAGSEQLLLTEAGTEHKAGIWLVPPNDEAAHFADLGPDADRVDVDRLATILAVAGGRLHGFLRDQHGVAGLGRRLANEVCWEARLSPFASAKALAPDEVARLHAAIVATVARDLEAERARSDMSASKDRPAAVHHRTGADCPRCGDTVHEVAYRAYQVQYCPTCQTGGRILADNTTSRFLK